MTEARTLILSRGNELIGTISWQRAITLFTLGRVEILESYDREVRSVTVIFKIPAVVRLLRKIPYFRRGVSFSRINIFARDSFACQYCGVKPGTEKLTFDHVVPKSRGGRTTWENVATACSRCNLRKGNRTPEEAGMRLRTHPHEPASVGIVELTIKRRTIPKEWRDCLASLGYWTDELGE